MHASRSWLACLQVQGTRCECKFSLSDFMFLHLVCTNWTKEFVCSEYCQDLTNGIESRTVNQITHLSYLVNSTWFQLAYKSVYKVTKKTVKSVLNSFYNNANQDGITNRYNFLFCMHNPFTQYFFTLGHNVFPFGFNFTSSFFAVIEIYTDYQIFSKLWHPTHYILLGFLSFPPNATKPNAYLCFYPMAYWTEWQGTECKYNIYVNE